MARKPPGDDYDVGYGKPPKHSQFQPGRSGNPKGRAKGAKSLASHLNDGLGTKMEVTLNGVRKNVTNLQLILMQLVNKAPAENPRATRLLLGLMQTMEAQAAQEPATAPVREERPISEIDAEILEELNARFLIKEEEPSRV